MPLLALALACGGGGVGTGPGADTAGDPGREPGLEIVIPVDVPAEVPPDGGDDPDAPADAPLDTPAEAETSTGCPGGYMCPCETNSDCFSELCLETQQGPTCSRACTDETSCPKGWACALVGSGADPVMACVPPATLCRPCTKDADCAYPGSGKNLCMYRGPDGSVCGVECSDSRPCPDGYQCLAVEQDGRSDAMQCIPEGGGACPCTEWFETQGYATECFVENGFGRCMGERACGMPCDAATPAAETCDGKDEDCDDVPDDGVEPMDCDKTNEFGTCPGKAECVGGKMGLCQGKDAAPEICNGADDDCDGDTDEEGATGCAQFWQDQDQDGLGAGDPKCLCLPTRAWTAGTAGDCDDANGDIHPGAQEACNGVDDDCVAPIDPEGAAGCTTYYLDEDQDGFGLTGEGRCLCAPDGRHTATVGGDCDDAAPAVTVCADFHADADGDGAGSDLDTACLCAAEPPYTASAGGDCDDANGDIHPGAQEACNGVDDDCDGSADEDLDLRPCAIENGWGSCPGLTTCTGGQPSCEGTAPAEEACNGHDDDCDGTPDEGCVATRVIFQTFATAYVAGEANGIRYRGTLGQAGPVGRYTAMDGSSRAVCLGVYCALVK